MNFFTRIFFCSLFLIANTSFGQDFAINFSKGSSILYYDVDSKADLSNRLSISLKSKKSILELGYFGGSYSDQRILLNDYEIYENYISNTNNLFFSYGNEFANFGNFKFYLGLEVGAGQFSNFTNLENKLGLSYLDYNFDEWWLSEVGFYSDNDYETSLSELNIDGLKKYETNFFFLGPSFECAFGLVDRLEISFKSVYRKNSTDLLDNVNTNNIRNISAKSSSDNQFDFFVGIKFQLNSKKEDRSDSLMVQIESVIKDSVEADVEDVSIVRSEQAQTNQAIISKEQYILDYFDFEADQSQTDSDFEIIDIDSNLVDNNSKSIIIEDFYVEQDSLESQSNQINSSGTYFLVVGVFSEINNLKKMAKSLEISPENFFVKNNLNYLYIFNTEFLEEARQLRSSFSVDCWIYSDDK